MIGNNTLIFNQEQMQTALNFYLKDKFFEDDRFNVGAIDFSTEDKSFKILLEGIDDAKGN